MHVGPVGGHLEQSGPFGSAQAERGPGQIGPGGVALGVDASPYGHHMDGWQDPPAPHPDAPAPLGPRARGVTSSGIVVQ